MRNFFVTKTHDHVLFFTNKGRAYRLRGYEIPDTTRNARGTALVNLLTLPPGEEVTAVFPIHEFAEGEKYMVMVTHNGVIKKTQLDEFANVRRNGLNAINLDEGDELLAVDLSERHARHHSRARRRGMAVHFNEKDVRPMGRNARGVKAMTLDEGDTIVAMDVIEDERKEVLARHVAGLRKTHADRGLPPHLARRQGRQGVCARARGHRPGARPDPGRAGRSDPDDHQRQSSHPPEGRARSARPDARPRACACSGSAKATK